MASKKQHAAIDFQGAATITIGGTSGNSQYLKTASNGLLQWASGTGVTKVSKYVVWNNTLSSDAGVAFSSDVCTITHNLTTTDVVVSAIDHSAWTTDAVNEQVDMNAYFIVKCPTASTITIHFHTSVAVGASDFPNFSVTIIG